MTVQQNLITLSAPTAALLSWTRKYSLLLAFLIACSTWSFHFGAERVAYISLNVIVGVDFHQIGPLNVI